MIAPIRNVPLLPGTLKNLFYPPEKNEYAYFARAQTVPRQRKHVGPGRVGGPMLRCSRGGNSAGFLEIEHCGAKLRIAIEDEVLVVGTVVERPREQFRFPHQWRQGRRLWRRELRVRRPRAQRRPEDAERRDGGRQGISQQSGLSGSACGRDSELHSGAGTWTAEVGWERKRAAAGVCQSSTHGRTPGQGFAKTAFGTDGEKFCSHV
jgi:hypothetical protein